MNSRKHLNYEELLRLYSFLSKSYSMNYITQLLNCDRTTIYRIIKKHRYFIPGKRIFVSRSFKNCIHINECKKNKIYECPNNCKLFKKYECPKLSKFPYICDFCSSKQSCLKDKYLFNPEQAYVDRLKELKESRSKTQVNKETLKTFDSFISPLIKNGLSIESIEALNKESFPVSTRQVREWVDKKYLSVSRADLINAQTRPYKKEYHYQSPSKDPLAKVGRTYESYLSYSEAYGDDRFEFDTVHGKRQDKKCILTIHYPRFKFQFGFLLSSCSGLEVLRVMKEIKKIMGKDNFIRLFKVILADNGPEFDKLNELEIDEETNEKIISVFYTRPYRSGDKGSCEKNHVIFRYIIQKGISFEDLTQEDVNFMFSNINSYPRKSLGYKSPYDLMKEKIKEEILNKLGITKIEFKKITFKKKKVR